MSLAARRRDRADIGNRAMRPMRLVKRSTCIIRLRGGYDRP
jgi:hypothetical protein